ncbi:hypothetical protein [uncultured Cohaesibacter sp.]|uniref:hypothetical protein n=1 Tax=uncultured Cohaesibacter sp. TaxID=1002546 RepID=UPI0029C712AC|nr:hypothetical protein [uncultured Cohaesibacter sp.]
MSGFNIMKTDSNAFIFLGGEEKGANAILQDGWCQGRQQRCQNSPNIKQSKKKNIGKIDWLGW